MFEDVSLPLIKAFVEEGGYQHAVDEFSYSHGFAEFEESLRLLGKAYAESEHKEHWLNFWEMLLKSKGPGTVEFDFMVEKYIEYALSKQDFTFLPKTLFSKVLQKVALDCLACINSPRYIPLILRILSEVIPPQHQSFIYQELVKLSLLKCNGPLLQALAGLGHSFHWETTISELNLSAEAQQKLNLLLDLDEDRAFDISETMKPFVNGFGRIEKEDALLWLAEKRDHKKTYNVDPVVLYELEPSACIDGAATEFEKLISIIADAPKPITVRFILIDIHYTCGEIYIDASEKGHILFLDPLGAGRQDDGTSKTIYNVEEMKTFAEYFPDNEIYVSRAKKQFSDRGCSVFALDDLRHLYTLKIEGNVPLWEYLAISANKPTGEKIEFTLTQFDYETEQETEKNFTIHSCDMPLSLLRTMQSRSLLSRVIPSRSAEEQHLAVNKKGESAYQSTYPFFAKKEGEGPERNTRLDVKLNKMANDLFNFLIKHSHAEIEAKKTYFSLNSFAERQLERKKNTRNTP